MNGTLPLLQRVRLKIDGLVKLPSKDLQSFFHRADVFEFYLSLERESALVGFIQFTALLSKKHHSRKVI